MKVQAKKSLGELALDVLAGSDRFNLGIEVRNAFGWRIIVAELTFESEVFESSTG
ncbi:MAG: hypothetical protein LC634_11775 [Sphingomonadales bacterium]|nr:hypothetical protein [Sphingomonadales bacterium]